MANKNMVRLGGAYVEITADNSKLVDYVKDSEDKLKNFASEFQHSAASMTAFGAAISVPMKKAVDYFGEFEKQMLITRAVTQSSERQMARLTNQAKELGATTSWTARQVAEGMTALGRMGFSNKEIERTITSVMDLGRALDVDVATSAKELGSVMRQFGADSSQAGHYADVLAKSTNSAAMEMSDLLDTMKYVGSVGNAINMDVESVLALVAALRNAGATASQAGTQLRSIFLKFQTPKNVQIFADKFGVDIKDANGRLKSFIDIVVEAQHRARALGDDMSSVARKMFGTLQAPGYINLLQATGLEEFRDELYNCDGAAEEFRKAMEGGVFGSVKLSESAIEAITNDLGQSLAPVVSEVRDIIIDMSATVRQFIEDHKPLVSLLARTGLAFGTVGSILLSVVGVFKISSTFMHLLSAGATKIATTWRATSAEAKRLKKETAALNAEMAKLKANEPNASIAAPFEAISAAAEAAAISVGNLNAQLEQTAGSVISAGRVSKALFHKYNEGEVSFNSTSYLVGGGERSRYGYNKTNVDERTVMVNGRPFKEDRAAAGEEFKERETTRIRAREEELRAHNERVIQRAIKEEERYANEQRAGLGRENYLESQRIDAARERTLADIDKRFEPGFVEGEAEVAAARRRLDEFETRKSRNAAETERWAQEQIAAEQRVVAAEEQKVKAIQESVKAEKFTAENLRDAQSAANKAYAEETKGIKEAQAQILSERKTAANNASNSFMVKARALIRSSANSSMIKNEATDPLIALTERYIAGDKSVEPELRNVLNSAFDADGMAAQNRSLQRYVDNLAKAKETYDAAVAKHEAEQASRTILSPEDQATEKKYLKQIEAYKTGLQGKNLTQEQKDFYNNEIKSYEKQLVKLYAKAKPHLAATPQYVSDAQVAYDSAEAQLSARREIYDNYVNGGGREQAYVSNRDKYLDEFKRLSKERDVALREAETLREGEYASNNTVMVTAQTKRDTVIAEAERKRAASKNYDETVATTNQALKQAQAESKARITAINDEAKRLQKINSEDAKRGFATIQGQLTDAQKKNIALSGMKQASVDAALSVYAEQEKTNDARLKEAVKSVDQGSKAMVSQINQIGKEAQTTLHTTANGVISNIENTVKAQSEAVARESQSFMVKGGAGKASGFYVNGAGGASFVASGGINAGKGISTRVGTISLSGMSAGERASFFKASALEKAILQNPPITPEENFKRNARPTYSPAGEYAASQGVNYSSMTTTAGTSFRDISVAATEATNATVSLNTAMANSEKAAGQLATVTSTTANATHTFTSETKQAVVNGKLYTVETNNAADATKKLGAEAQKSGKMAKVASAGMHALSFAAKGLAAVGKFFGGMMVTLAAWQGVMLVFEKIASFAKQTAENMEKARESNDALLNKDAEATDKAYANLETDEQKIDKLVEAAGNTEPVTASEKHKLDALYKDLASRGITKTADDAALIIPDQDSPSGYRVVNAGAADWMKARAIELQLPELQRQAQGNRFDVSELDPSKFAKFTEIGYEDAQKYLDQYKSMYEVLSSLTPGQRNAMFGKNSWWTGRWNPFSSGSSLFQNRTNTKGRVVSSLLLSPAASVAAAHLGSFSNKDDVQSLVASTIEKVKAQGELTPANETALRSLLEQVLATNLRDYDEPMKNGVMSGAKEIFTGDWGLALLRSLTEDQGQGFMDTYKKLQDFGASNKAVEDLKATRDAFLEDAKAKSTAPFESEQAQAKAEAEAAAMASALKDATSELDVFQKKLDDANLTPAQRQMQELELMADKYDEQSDGAATAVKQSDAYKSVQARLRIQAKDELQRRKEQEKERLDKQVNEQATNDFAALIKDVRAGKINGDEFIKQYDKNMMWIDKERDLSGFYQNALSEVKGLITDTKTTLSSVSTMNAFEFADMANDSVVDVQRQQLDQLRNLGSQARMIYSWMVTQDEYKDFL